MSIHLSEKAARTSATQQAKELHRRKPGQMSSGNKYREVGVKPVKLGFGLKVYRTYEYWR